MRLLKSFAATTGCVAIALGSATASIAYPPDPGVIREGRETHLYDLGFDSGILIASCEQYGENKISELDFRKKVSYVLDKKLSNPTRAFSTFRELADKHVGTPLGSVMRKCVFAIMAEQESRAIYGAVGSGSLPQLASSDDQCNKRVDTIFYERYPMLRGKKLQSMTGILADDWMDIRDSVC